MREYYVFVDIIVCKRARVGYKNANAYYNYIQTGNTKDVGTLKFVIHLTDIVLIKRNLSYSPCPHPYVYMV